MYKLTSSSRAGGKTFYLATKIQEAAIRTNRAQIVLMLVPNKKNRTIIVYPEDSITEIMERLRKGDVNMLHDRKYEIKENGLVKRMTGVPVPNDVPLFILLATDIKALPVLVAYNMIINNLDHKVEVNKTIDDFRKFQENHPERVLEPDP